MSSRLRAGVIRFISIADTATDDDDLRLRKRMGVVAGYLTIIAPLGAPASVSTPIIGWILAVGLSSYSVAILWLLARTKRFERYVMALMAAGPPFVLLASTLAGGVTSSSGALVWAFLGPAYTMVALGSRRATPWFFIFLATLVLAVVIDPFVREIVPAPAYVTQLVFYVQNIGVPLTITFLLLRYSDLRRRVAEARSDELLTNAIPVSIAIRLRRGENRIAEAYPDTSIVFADIAAFTPWAQVTDPATVVAILDDLFSRIDRLAGAHGVEKIKTVGDAYMAAVGAPAPRPDHAASALQFGRAILAEAARWREANDLDLQLRIGIASGAVVGGIIGQRRITFDLWGDTVNVAARMESSGVAGRIQLAASTMNLLGDSAGFEERGLEVKGLGAMTTYLADA